MTSNSSFGAKTDANDVLAAFPNAVKGKNSKCQIDVHAHRVYNPSANHSAVLITGVSPNGLGAALAHALAPYHPNLLVLTGRTAAKVEAVASPLAKSFPDVQVRTVLFDMSSFASIAQAAAEINAFTENIDILFNNAGIMNVPERRLSVDGFEMHLATNYLGLALFTLSILPKILSSTAGRIVNTVSNGYALSPCRFSDYNFDYDGEGGGKEVSEDEQPPKDTCAAFGVPWGLGYIPPIAYAQSKTAAILFTRELADRLAEKDVTVNCVQPGGMSILKSTVAKRTLRRQMLIIA
jgi:NAD(P)-dependent dehydrogenase (short-subunit alcohol dehydrogenase family)